MKWIVVIVLWFSLGYVGAAQWAGSFYGDKLAVAMGIETRGSAARSSLTYFVMGPIGAFDGFALSTHRPMWDWPKYLFEYSDGAQQGQK